MANFVPCRSLRAFVLNPSISSRCTLRLRRFSFSPNSKLAPCRITCRFSSYRPVSAPNSGEVDSKVLSRDYEEDFVKRLAFLKMKLEQHGIDCGSCRTGLDNHLICPRCKGGVSEEKSLSVFISNNGGLAKWSCAQAKCGWNGHVYARGDAKLSQIRTNWPEKVVKETMDDNLHLEPLSKEAHGVDVSVSHAKQNEPEKVKKLITEYDLHLEPLCEELISWFSDRRISIDTLRRNSIKQREYKNEIVIAFPYRRNGALVSCKYRSVSKKFWQERGAERILYGLDDIENANEIIIVEGEIDKLSMEEAGFRNCVSVPDGAPARVSSTIPPIEEDTKFQFLWNCKDYLQKASRIILATDADKPGQALAEELARRLGKERCWRVKWPSKFDNEVCKDANEVLLHFGSEALKKVVEQAEFYPVKGLFSFRDFFTEIDDYYHQRCAFDLGVSTGWRSLNELYNVMPGELTVITGVPNSGKSEWIDALMCNINKSNGWKFVLCSMENKVREHARKLMEKHIKKPFFNARYGELTERMSVQEFEQGKQWLDQTFSLIRCEDDSLPSIKWVLHLAKVAVLRHGVRGLVIDPYNELDHQRSPSQTETEYVSQMLTLIKRFAQHHSCHVWFVAHPKQLQHWDGGAPNLYDISGSAHFINKCDNGIVIHRNRDQNAGPIDRVQVCVRKVRNKVIGRIGDAYLSYNRVTGEFVDVDS